MDVTQSFAITTGLTHIARVRADTFLLGLSVKSNFDAARLKQRSYSYIYAGSAGIGTWVAQETPPKIRKNPATRDSITFSESSPFSLASNLLDHQEPQVLKTGYCDTRRVALGASGTTETAMWAI